MCGIAGILNFSGKPVDHDALLSACQAMRHRGPDDYGIFVDDAPPTPLGFASVRLAVVDPTPAGHQPFLYDRGNYALSFNGEIYNYRELRRELSGKGMRFSTDTDTEVVAASCVQWGENAPSRFNGMFAFAFYDIRQKTGFIVRDHFGIKPLLYRAGHNDCAFASEMSALLELATFDRRIDDEALLHYLHFGYFAAPASVYSAVRRLQPGHLIRFANNRLSEPARYSTLSQGVTRVTHETRAERCRRIRRALYRSVAKRRLADVPLGAFLSGGLDSSIIATHLAQCTPAPITTFSIGYPQHDNYDERHFARMVAHRLGSRHHELSIESRDIVEAVIPVLNHLSEPFGDSSIVPTAIVSHLARQQVTVCLSGDGGDELFGGYWRYLGHESLRTYRRIPQWLRSLIIEPLVNHSRHSKSSAVGNRLRQLRKLLRAECESTVERHLAWSLILSPEARIAILKNSTHDVARNRALNGFRNTCALFASDDALNQILSFDLRYSLPNDMLHKVDLASMLHSLEVRVPFLDPEVVAAAESCPSVIKVNGGRAKQLLVDAYRGLIPDPVLDRGKMGFEVPVGELLRADFKEPFLSTVTKETIESFGLLDYHGIQKVYQDHCEHRVECADLLFAIWSLCWWRSKH